MNKGIAILSASCLFNDKKKVTIKEVIKDGAWEKGTIMIVRKHNGNLLFVFGSGNSKGYSDLTTNKTLTFIHDQRRTRVAEGLCIGFVDFTSHDDYNNISDEVNNYKAPIWVFK